MITLDAIQATVSKFILDMYPDAADDIDRFWLAPMNGMLQFTFDCAFNEKADQGRMVILLGNSDVDFRFILFNDTSSIEEYEVLKFINDVNRKITMGYFYMHEDHTVRYHSSSMLSTLHIEDYLDDAEYLQMYMMRFAYMYNIAGIESTLVNNAIRDCIDNLDKYTENMKVQIETGSNPITLSQRMIEFYNDAKKRGNAE